MTAHWIDPNTLQHCNAALSCSRLTGHNTYDVLAERRESIHRPFDLSGKVTDNGSNFFRHFSPDTILMSKEDAQQHEEEVEDEAQFEDV